MGLTTIRDTIAQLNMQARAQALRLRQIKQIVTDPTCQASLAVSSRKPKQVMTVRVPSDLPSEPPL